MILYILAYPSTKPKTSIELFGEKAIAEIKSGAWVYDSTFSDSISHSLKILSKPPV